MAKRKKNRKTMPSQSEKAGQMVPQVIRFVLQFIVLAMFLFLIQRTYDRLSNYEGFRCDVNYLDYDNASRNTRKIQLRIYKLGSNSTKDITLYSGISAGQEVDFEIVGRSLKKYAKSCVNTLLVSRRQYETVGEATLVDEPNSTKYVAIDFDTMDKDAFYEVTLDIKSKTGKPIEKVVATASLVDENGKVWPMPESSRTDQMILCIDELYFASLLVLIFLMVLTWQVSKRLIK